MTRFLTTIALLLTFISITPYTEASIVGLNDGSLSLIGYESADGNNITLDTSTGLEWLDIDTTTNRSYVDTVALFATDLAGFRYATLDEVGVFFTALGLDTAAWPAFTDSYVSDGEGALGYTGESWSGSARHGTHGFTFTATGDSFRMPGFSVWYSGLTQTYATTAAPGSVIITSGVGSWVVRDAAAVPEPASVVVWSFLGAMGLAIAGWRRRSRLHSSSSV